MSGEPSFLLPSQGLHSWLHQPPLAKELKGKLQQPGGWGVRSSLPGAIPPSLPPPPSFLSRSSATPQELRAQHPISHHCTGFWLSSASNFLPPSNP